MGFKSRTNPARVVFLTSGLHCQLFSAKKRPEGNSHNPKVA